MIRWSIGIVFSALVCACSTIHTAELKEEIFPIDPGRTAVLFIDENNQIFYRNNYFLVFFNVKHTDETNYLASWDNSIELSELHAEQLRKLGLNTRSIYELFGKDRATELASSQRKRNLEATAKNSDMRIDTPPIDAQLRAELAAKNVERLLLIRGNGFKVFTAVFSSTSEAVAPITYLKYDIPDGTLLWSGYVRLSRTLDMGEKKSKDFLERDGFVGLQSVTRQLVEEKYADPGSDRVIQRIVGTHQ